jgi:membrane protease YdiL (CAAX protease family)
LVFYSGLLIILFLYVAWWWEYPAHRLLTSLVVIPIARLLGFSLPLADFPPIYRYLLISIPLLATILLICRTVRLSWHNVGLVELNPKKTLLQITIGLSGLVVGYVHYQLMKPAAIVAGLNLEHIWLPVLILVLCTGFIEELLFRGLLQYSIVNTVGAIGILYVAILYTLLQSGDQTVYIILFVFSTSLFWALLVRTTQNILGVSISHGLSNVMLFVIAPFLPSSSIGAAIALGIPILVLLVFRIGRSVDAPT